MAEITLTTQNFDAEVLQSALPVLVDFWATWCPPCQKLGPIIAQIAEEYEGRVVVGKVNTDNEPALADKYGITSIPTVILFRDGKPVAISVGFRPKEYFEAMLK